MTRLKAKRDLLAASLGLDPGFLASRALLTSAARLVLKGEKLEEEALVAEAGFSRWRAGLLAAG